MGAPDGSCFQYKGCGADMSHIFLLNNPHFQKEFQKMLARKQTVFSFSLHFADFFAHLSREIMTEKCCVPPVFSVERGEFAQETQSVLYITPHSRGKVTIKLKFLYISCV